MLISACVMLVSYAVICLFTGGFKRDVPSGNGEEKKARRQFVLYALVSGALSCGYNRLNIYLSGALDGVIFFPVFNGGVIFLSTVFSILLLKEKLNLKQIAGICVGIAGICVIGIL